MDLLHLQNYRVSRVFVIIHFAIKCKILIKMVPTSNEGKCTSNIVTMSLRVALHNMKSKIPIEWTEQDRMNYQQNRILTK
jgi:hypothetical protein